MSRLSIIISVSLVAVSN